MEIWKDIEGYGGKYQISSTGKVRSFTRWKNGDELKLHITTTGYYYVHLVGKGRNDIARKMIHRIVAETFIPNPNDLAEVNHIDGDKLNNCIENLEWVSREQNIQHAYSIGLIKKRVSKFNPNSKIVIQKDKNGDVVKEWDSVADIHREKGYSTNSIICCCNKKPKYHTAYGYKWEYKEM